jgi:hypothetical protein
VNAPRSQLPQAVRSIVQAAQDAPGRAARLDEAYRAILAVESALAGASALLERARPSDREDREAIRIALLCIGQVESKRFAATECLDAPGGARFATREQLGHAIKACDSALDMIESTLGELAQAPSHGNDAGAGAATFHADMILHLGAEKLERARSLIARTRRADTREAA